MHVIKKDIVYLLCFSKAQSTYLDIYQWLSIIIIIMNIIERQNYRNNPWSHWLDPFISRLWWIIQIKKWNETKEKTKVMTKRVPSLSSGAVTYCRCNNSALKKASWAWISFEWCHRVMVAIFQWWASAYIISGISRLHYSMTELWSQNNFSLGYECCM